MLYQICKIYFAVKFNLFLLWTKNEKYYVPILKHYNEINSFTFTAQNIIVFFCFW